jgi:D-glycero-D-manno-heptose 1,7-bisphosphate phosphatase
MNERSAVFLDLQGTLGGEGLSDIRDFTFYPFAITAIKLLNESGLPAIVITNQSNIAKGLFTIDYFRGRMEMLKEELARNGAHLDAVYCCPHMDEDECSCKKPKTGMVLDAQQDFGLDLKTCYIVGDTGAWDIVLANRVGCKGILVRTGLGESSLEEYRYTWADSYAYFIAEDVLHAVNWILADKAENIAESR